MATKHSKLPWTATPSMLQSRRYFLTSLSDECRVAEGLKRLDAAFILRVIEDRERIKNENASLRKRLHDAEATVKRMRAYIRQNELKTLRGMKIVQQEPI